MDKFLTRVRKKYGDEVVGEVPEGIRVIPTGITSLDVSLGIGGIPKGRISLIYGAESSGKTTLALEICKQALKQGEKVLYLDSEQALDLQYAYKIFGDISVGNFTLLQLDTAEDTLEIVEMGVRGNEKFEVEAGEWGLIVVDSIDLLAPKKEKYKDELTDDNYALVAKLMTKFTRRNAFDLRTKDTALLFIGQVRDKIGGFARGYTMTGGHALLHAAAIIIFLSRVGVIKENDEPTGILSKFLIKKNKLGTPFRQWDQLPIMFEEGVDYYKDLVEFAKLLGILRTAGSFYKFGDETLGQGYAKTRETLENDEELLDKIRNMCYNTRNIKVIEEFENEKDDYDGEDLSD
jgi:recombination protein RecA